MANKGKNTNGSQFFITLRQTDHLDGLHVVFGNMIYGEKVLRAIEIGGSKCGKTTQDFIIENCGEIQDFQN